MDLPSRYLAQPAMTDKHLRHAPSALEFLLSQGMHQYSAKYLWKQLSAHHQLGHCTSFSPTVWLETGTVGFLNPWLC